MLELKNYEVWFLCGSQNLYGEDTLRQVAENSRSIAEYLDSGGKTAVRVIWKPVLKSPDEISAVINEAEAEEKCVGIICWMHTFSPAKMWINGLGKLEKPMLHLHTQFNRELPWNSIDMDFMNLNQSAHGGREFGFICTRMGIRRKVVTGFWQDDDVTGKIDVWCRTAAALADSRKMKIARIGDNMREVAVTEGNKVSAQMTFGYSVNGYGSADVVKFIDEISDSEADSLLSEYKERYSIPDKSTEKLASIRDAAKIEAGLGNFLEDGNFSAFTTTFENLNGFKQLPGLAVQRLMEKGYGFGAEGDWKTAALLRSVKVMATGLKGGTSFMEDYTYHLEKGNELVLGAHMLEVCPSISGTRASLEVHPLGIGGKEDPARLVFDADEGPAVNASMIELGTGYRLIVNELEVCKPPQNLPKLPVARAVCKPLPDLKTAAGAWILAGGAHHSAFSQALTTEFFEDFAEMTGIELVVIDEKTRIRNLKNILAGRK